MANAPTPLSELEHREFDEYLLRTFADVIPWYIRPQVAASPYAVQDYVGYVHEQYLSVLHPERANRIKKQPTNVDRKFYQHHWYQIVREALRLHAYHRDAPFQEELVANARETTALTFQKYIMPVQDFLHPLVNDPAVEHISRKGVRCLAVVPTQDDKVLAQWIADPTRFRELIGALPYLQELSPRVRISEYAREVRAKVQEAIKLELTTDVRADLVMQISHEWLKMVQYSLEDAEALSLRRVGESDFLSLSIEDRIQKIVLPPDEAWLPKEEQPRRLIFDSAVISCAESGNRSLYPLLEHAGGEFLDHYPLVAPCDRPASSLARLALAVRFETAAVVRSFC